MIHVQVLEQPVVKNLEHAWNMIKDLHINAPKIDVANSGALTRMRIAAAIASLAKGTSNFVSQWSHW